MHARTTATRDRFPDGNGTYPRRGEEVYRPFVRLPRVLMRLIDPANVYMDDRSPLYRGPMYRGKAFLGPDVPGSSQQDTQEELDAIRRQADLDDREQHGARIDGRSVAAAAHDLNTTGAAHLNNGRVALSARLVTFWRGDAVLEITRTGTGTAGRSRTRVSPRPSDERESTFCSYLSRHLDRSS